MGYEKLKYFLIEIHFNELKILFIFDSYTGVLTEDLMS
jgi:hypothetical protein